MAFQSAGAARYRSRAQRGRRRLLVMLGALLVLAVLGVAAYWYFSSRAAGTQPSKTAPSLSFGAKQAMDLNLVAGAVGQYASANGVLPAHFSATQDGRLVLCGTVCDPTLYAVGGFRAYNAANIRLMNYTAGLAVPDQNTMYVVPGAKCGSDGHAGDPNPISRSAVILYGAQTSSGTTTRCIVL